MSSYVLLCLINFNNSIPDMPRAGIERNGNIVLEAYDNKSLVIANQMVHSLFLKGRHMVNNRCFLADVSDKSGVTE